MSFARPFVRRLIAAAFAAVCLATSAAAQDAATIAANQRAFEAGARAMLAGDYARAIAIFEPLAETTGAPRVRLELGRSLFLAGEYSRARTEFLKVYHSRGLPYPVRRGINLFLDEIDDRIGYVRPQLNLVLDNNPTHSAASGVYNILGAPLQFNGSDRKPALGAIWRADGLRPLTRGSAWAMVGEADGAVYDAKGADYANGQVGLHRADFARGAYVEAGFRGGGNASLQFRGPYLNYGRRFVPKPDRQTNLSLGFQWRNYAQADDLDEAEFSVSLAHARDLGRHWSGTLSGGATIGTSANSVLPNRTLWTQIGAVVALPQANKNLTVSVAQVFDGYGRADVFFGDRRRDAVTLLNLGVYSGEPVLGVFPGLALSYSHRSSNIAFFGYDQMGASVDFRRRF